APTGLVPVERWLLHYPALSLASPPPGWPRWSAGLQATGARLRPDPGSTRTSPVGAPNEEGACSAQTRAPPWPARWGRNHQRGSGSAEASAPPGQARWGPRQEEQRWSARTREFEQDHRGISMGSGQWILLRRWVSQFTM